MECRINKGFLSFTEGQLGTDAYLALPSPAAGIAIFRWYEE